MFLLGAICLGSGILLYVRLALYRTGSLVPVFFLIMLSLGFFNAPTSLARRWDRKHGVKPENEDDAGER